MKRFPLISSIFAVGLAISTPTVGLAHVGHGDEFQAEGGVQRVKVNPETDQMLGIVVTPIASATDGSATVMIPVTALVDADGRQLVFVQYENFYEPVPVKTGATKGELLEVTEGLAVGEKLVTQGSLSLFAESRKSQTATASPNPVAASPKPVASPQSETAPTQTQQGGLPMGAIAAVGGVAVLVGAIAVASTRKKKSAFSDRDGR
ncbi:cobalt transporter [Leptolyngbyaceae cyanobacterium UHCC 1019]